MFPMIILLVFGLTSCAVKRGGKKHRRPSGGSGKGCDCPTLGHVSPQKTLTLNQFTSKQA